MIMLGLHKGLPILLYFGSVLIILTADPDIEACDLNSVFATHRRGGLSYVALQR